MSEYEQKLESASMSEREEIAPCNKHSFPVLFVMGVGCALCHIREIESKLTDYKNANVILAGKVAEMEGKCAEWIHMSERGPAKHHSVITWDGEEMIDDMRTIDELTGQLVFTLGDVTHWMEWPEPPTDKSN